MDESGASITHTSPHEGVRLQRIIAGGQTGVDQAALRAATQVGLQTGGWCPLGCVDENGPIHDWEHWHLSPVTEKVWEANREQFESLGVQYNNDDLWARRTMMNALHSSGTLTILLKPVVDGTNLGMDIAKALAKPMLVLDLTSKGDDRQQFEAWLSHHAVKVLNINGPRESSCPGIHDECLPLFEDWFATVAMARAS